MIDKAREIALKTLYKIEKEKSYSNIVLDEIIKQNKKIINEKDIGLISQIVYGVTTWKLTLDEIIKKYSNIKLKKMSIWIINILRMGIYQIIFLDKIPKSAAVNESVNLAKRYGHKASSNFVNAILRKVEKTDFDEFFSVIKKSAKIPCAVGFGISGPEQAKMMSQYCDGVIVGSAIVKIISKYGEESPEKVYEFTKSLRDAIDEGM